MLYLLLAPEATEILGFCPLNFLVYGREQKKFTNCWLKMFGLYSLLLSIGCAGASPFLSADYGIIIKCLLLPDRVEIPLFFHSHIYPVVGKEGKSELAAALKYANALNVFFPELPSETSEWDASRRLCEVRSKSGKVAIPVSYFVHDMTLSEISVVNVGADSDVFPIVDSIGFNYRRTEHVHSSINVFFSTPGYARPDAILGCFANGENRISPQMLDYDATWSLSLQDIGVASAKGFFPIDITNTLRATLSFTTRGLVLPHSLYDSFLERFSQAAAYEIVSVKEGIRVKNCDEKDEKLLRGLPSLVLTFVGSDGAGIEVRPSMFVHPLPNRECEVNVFRSDQDKGVLLGDAFFRTGLVQISLDRELVLCPDFKLQATAIDASSRPSSNGSSVELTGKSHDASGVANKIIVGVTIGGIVLIFSVVAYFIIRAKRRQVFENRDDPRRFMVQDPSVVGSDFVSSVTDATPVG